MTVPMIRPTLILRFHLTESSYTDENIAEIKRSYSHIAPCAVDQRVGEAESDIRGNVLTLDIKSRIPYWDSSDATAQEAWTQLVSVSLKNMFYKISAAMTGLNGVHFNARQNGIYFSWVELDFHENPHIMLHLNEDSSFEVDALDYVNMVRNSCNDGRWGTGIRTVFVPSPASFNAQEDALKTTEQEVIAEAESHDPESPAPVEDQVITIDDSINPEEETPFVDSDAPLDFAIDFTTWRIGYLNGEIREISMKDAR